MTIYSFYASISIFLAALRYISYFHTIYKGKTKPHAFSWFIWALAAGIGTFAQFSLNSGAAVWAIAFVSLSCFVIAVIGFVEGERSYTKSDWIAFLLSLLAIPLWQLTSNPLTAIFMVIFIESISSWPTVRKSFHAPETEPPLSWLLSGARYLFAILAIPEPTLSNLIYPVYLMLADMGLGVYILIRRHQLGHSIHEYAGNDMKKD